MAIEIYSDLTKFQNRADYFDGALCRIRENSGYRQNTLRYALAITQRHPSQQLWNLPQPEEINDMVEANLDDCSVVDSLTEDWFSTGD